MSITGSNTATWAWLITMDTHDQGKQSLSSRVLCLNIYLCDTFMCIYCMNVCNFLFRRFISCSVWHSLLEPLILWPQQASIKSRCVLKYWAGIAAFLVQYDIAFMAPTQRYYAHISSTSFGQNLLNPFSSSRHRSGADVRGKSVSVQ